MSYINFTPTASNAFQNALAQGLQFGARASEAANRRGFNNALAGYDPNNPDSFKEVAKYDPRTAVILQRDARAQQSQERQQQQQEGAIVRKLLLKAKENPAEALGAAQQLGIDIEGLGVPPVNDPNFQPWVDRQLFIMDALESPQGQEILSTAGKQAYDEGLRPGTDGRFEQRVREITEAGLVKITSVQPGGTIAGINTRTGESRIFAGPNASGVDYDPNDWEVVEGGTAGNGGGGF